MSHTHPCQHCLSPADCCGEWELNHDGLPELICPVFHLSCGHINPDFLCDECEAEQLRYQAAEELRDRKAAN